MIENCLLIKVKDKRKFLTHEKNLPTLVEFAKTFHAEILLVQPEKGQKVMKLKALTEAVCNSEYDNFPKYTKIIKVFPKSKRSRQSILTEAGKIRDFIKKNLMNGKALSLKELKNKYKEQMLTDACLCNHLSIVRKSLLNEGHTFRKLGAGNYCLTTS